MVAVVEDHHVWASTILPERHRLNDQVELNAASILDEESTMR
jgi:hypothetical protein